MIEDFLREEPDIYTPMFQYERRGQEQVRKLAIQRYFTSWINRHWEIIEDIFTQEHLAPADQEQIQKSFADVFRQLLQKIWVSRNMVHNIDFMAELIAEKIRAMDEILLLEGKMNRQLNKLKHDYEKDKAIYDRFMNRLGEGNQ
ncbi:MAG: hypothetical protein HQK70_12595 [Desulfamplus sp.]|nr:hypothetical protein [Desulfamplus sp.]